MRLVTSSATNPYLVRTPCVRPPLPAGEERGEGEKLERLGRANTGIIGTSSPSPRPSPAGRGRTLDVCSPIRTRSFVRTRPVWPPRPAGEGWGEGEARIFCAACFGLWVSSTHPGGMTESSRGLSAATPPRTSTPLTTLKGSGNDLENGTAPAPLQGACRSGREPGVSLLMVA